MVFPLVRAALPILRPFPGLADVTLNRIWLGRRDPLASLAFLSFLARRSLFMAFFPLGGSRSPTCLGAEQRRRSDDNDTNDRHPAFNTSVQRSRFLSHLKFRACQYGAMLTSGIDGSSVTRLRNRRGREQLHPSPSWDVRHTDCVDANAGTSPTDDNDERG